MKAVVLCGGYATRMYPLTRDFPKPLLEVGGAPILTHLSRRISALAAIDEIVVVSNHRFHAAFESWAAGARSEISLPIRLLDDGSSDETNRLGALGDLAFAARETPLAQHDTLVAAGDNLILFDLAPLAAAFERLRAPVVAMRRIDADATRSRYGEVTLGDGGRIARFREKPEKPESELASIALYLFPKRIWPLLSRYLADGGDQDAPGHFIAWLVRETEVYAEPISGSWWDMGDLASLAQARANVRPG